MEPLTVNLTQLRKTIFANGNIDAEDVRKLREAMFSDEGMDRRKADFLFEVKDTVAKEKQHATFKNLFIEAITSYLLEDEDSPGEIEEGEAKWLRARIQYKGKMDSIDELLLKNLRMKSINFPQTLNYKSATAKFFEQTLYWSRYLSILAVVGSIAAGVAIFIRSSIIVCDGLYQFCTTLSSTDEHVIDQLLAKFVESVDLYLFAMVLIIFGMGIYELFINKIDPVERKTDSRPTWLRISSIDDLKSSLGKVILMVLIVSLFRHSLTLKYESVVELLELAVAIVLVAAALYVAHASPHGHESKEKE
jgi:uncharacterized membrane protein YqhA